MRETVSEIAAIELGGSHVAAARVDLTRRTVVGGMTRVSFRTDASRTELIEAVSNAARTVAVAGDLIGVAAPGPFDYDRGICKVRELAKLEALYDVDLRAELVAAVGAATKSVFLNDAEAFVLGEAWAGAAREHARVVGITLGTGLGSGFLADGHIVSSGPTVPPGGNVHLAPFRGAPVENAISARGILRRHPRRFDGVAELAAAARGGDSTAAEVFHQLGGDLGEFLAPWLERFAATCLVVGGSISRAWELFGPPLERSLVSTRNLETIRAAANADESPLLGAALFAAGPDGCPRCQTPHPSRGSSLSASRRDDGLGIGLGDRCRAPRAHSRSLEDRAETIGGADPGGTGLRGLRDRMPPTFTNEGVVAAQQIRTDHPQLRRRATRSGS